MRRLLTAGAVAGVLACGGDAGTGPSANIQGTYDLTSLNGQSLPVSFTETSAQGGTLTITYMAPFSITLNPDNALRIISTTRFTFNGISETATDTLAGTWKLNGSVVNLITVEGDTVSASWNGSNSLTITAPPDVLVFTK